MGNRTTEVLNKTIAGGDVSQDFGVAEGEYLDGLILDLTASISSASTPEARVTAIKIERNGVTVFGTMSLAEAEEVHRAILDDDPTTSGSNTSAYARCVLPIRLKPSPHKVLITITTEATNVTASVLKIAAHFVEGTTPTERYCKMHGAVDASSWGIPRDELKHLSRGLIYHASLAVTDTVKLVHQSKSVYDTIRVNTLASYMEARNITRTSTWVFLYTDLDIDSTTTLSYSRGATTSVITVTEG